jgi:hypothetical protein
MVGNSGFVVGEQRLGQGGCESMECKIVKSTGRFLGIKAPWFVGRVELKLDQGEVHIHLDHREMVNLAYPECGTDCKMHDHQPERRQASTICLSG